MTETETLSPEKQQQIMRGAAEIFARDGYEGASMSRIAACAGVSKGTLYNYFNGKAELFAAWVSQACEQHLATVFDIADPHGDPQTVLRAIGRRMLELMISPAGLTIYRMAVSEAGKFPEVARGFYEAGPARATEYMASWLKRQAANGQLQMDDPVFAAEQFFALCQTRVGMQIRLGLLTHLDQPAFDRVVGEAVAMFLKSYGVPR